MYQQQENVKLNTVFKHVNSFKKTGASAEDVRVLSKKLNMALDIWDFNDKEVLQLDKKSMLELFKSWYTQTKSKEDKELFLRVFSV